MYPFVRLAFALPLLVVAACTVTTGPRKSGGLMTGNLIPAFSARGDGARLTIDATLYASSVETVELSDGDHFEVTVGGAPVNLVKQGDNTYEGKLAMPAQEVPVLVAFRRAAGKTDAPSSVVTLPEPFIVVSASVAATWSASGDLALRTSGIKSTVVEVRVEAACLVNGVQSLTVIVGSNGDVVVSGSKLHFESAAPDCDVSATVVLSAQGKVDPALGVSSFDQGRGIFAAQERRVSTHVTP